MTKFSTVENLFGIIEIDNSKFSIVINYLKSENKIISGYLIVKSDFRVETNGILINLADNINLNGYFLTYMIGNNKNAYFYQPHKVTVKNGNILSDVPAFNAYTTRVFYN